jgi:hypothetical protein
MLWLVVVCTVFALASIALMGIGEGPGTRERHEQIEIAALLGI